MKTPIQHKVLMKIDMNFIPINPDCQWCPSVLEILILSKKTPLHSLVSETYFSDSVSLYDPYVLPDASSKQVW